MNDESLQQEAEVNTKEKVICFNRHNDTVDYYYLSCRTLYNRQGFQASKKKVSTTVLLV